MKAEGGDPDRQGRRDGQVAGEEGEREARHRDQQDQGGGVDRLGQVEPAQPMDVPGDAAALGDRARQPRELVLEQFNPPEGQDRLMRFPAGQVISVHRILFAGQS